MSPATVQSQKGHLSVEGSWRSLERNYEPIDGLPTIRRRLRWEKIPHHSAKR